MSFSYNKEDKLKQKKVIDRLFSSGESVGQYPLRLVYITDDPINDGAFKIGVSVSKRYFKKAVERNKIKRIIREAFRLQKPHVETIIKAQCNNGVYGMILYNGDEIPGFEDLHKCMSNLWLKFESKKNR